MKRVHSIFSTKTAYVLPVTLTVLALLFLNPNQSVAQDVCATATAIALPSATSDNTSLYTADIAPFCGTVNGTGGGVWYTFVGDGYRVTASLCGSSYDTKIRVYSGPCAGLVCVAGIDDFCALQSEVTFPTVFGTTYTILVHGFGAAQGAFTLNLAAANDDCITADPIGIGAGPVSGNTCSANAETVPFCGTGDGTGGGVWYTFTGNGSRLRASLCGSAYDTKIRVYDGSCGALNCVAGTDDGGGCPLQSAVDFCTTNATTYWILVHGFSSGCGVYSLGLTDIGSGPTATCQDITIQLNAGGTASIVAGDVDGGSTDECAFTLSATPTSFDCSDVGSNLVVLTITDGTGATDNCGANVEVEDVIDPVAVCQDITVELDGLGGVIADASDVNNGSSDICGIGNLTLDITAFVCSDLGSNAVVLTVTDNNSNTATCGANVEVEDNMDPAIICPADTVVTTDVGLCSAIVNYPVPSGSDNTGSDNCAGFTIIRTAGLGSGAIYPVGVTTETYLITDTSGNTATCSFLITINDNENPTAVCQDITVQLDASGNGSTTAATVDNGSDDACGIASLSLDITAFTCSDVGSNAVVLTVTDNNTNTATCGANVEVEDNVAPVALCQDITVQLDASGNGSTTAVAVNNGSSDACGIASLSLDITAFTCTEVGSNAVILTVTDNNGNSATCGANVEVEDNIGPSVTCQDITIQLDAGGNASITVDELTVGTNTIDIFILTDDFPLETSWEVRDGGALVDSRAAGFFTLANTLYTFNVAVDCGASYDFTIFDAFGDGICCGFGAGSYSVEVDAVVLASGGAFGASETTSIPVASCSANDACGVASVTADITTFTCSEVGGNTVTITATDVNGNTSNCIANVEVEDNVPPTVACSDRTVILDAAGNASIVVADITNGTNTIDVFILTDDFPLETSWHIRDGGGALIDSVVAGSLTLANTLYTYNASVDCGASYDFTIVDAFGDGICCGFGSGSYTVEVDAVVLASGGAFGAFETTSIPVGACSADDACGLASIVADITSFTCSDVGPNTVTVTATDVNGNITVCASTVTVLDTISPVALCQDITIQLDGTGNATADPANVDNGSSDVCGIANLSLDVSAFACADIGSNAVVLTVTDNSGNTATCGANVEVEDNVDPVLTPCPGNITDNVIPGLCGQSIFYTIPTATDNCPGVVVITTHPSGSFFAVGTTTVTVTATDGVGNTDECSFDVTIIDNENPIYMNCPTDIIQGVDAGLCEANVNWLPPTPSDNCPGFTESSTHLPFDIFPVGIATVEYVVTDASGLTDTCRFTVTVLDDEKPVALCKDTVLYLDASGLVTVTAEEIDTGSTDNCGVDTVTLSQTDFSCADVGANIITFTATDSAGNDSICITTITVLDTISPLAVCMDITVGLGADGTVSISAADVDGGSSDACGIASLDVVPTDFDCDEIGDTIVTLTVTDNNGNSSSCTAIVTVEDVIAPTALCQNITIQLDASGNASITASDVTFSIAGPTPSGMVNILTDNFGNETSAILVSSDGDTILNVIAGSLASNSFFAFPFTIDCDSSYTFTIFDSFGDGICCGFGAGAYSVELDGDTLVMGGAFGVSETTSVGCSNADNCGIDSSSIDISSFDCSDVGDNSVTLTVVDVNGNSASCTAIVTVEDVTPPTALCQDITIFFDGVGSVSIAAADIDAGSTDECGVASLDADPNIFGCGMTGDNSVTLTVTDPSGNSATCIATVTILDTIAPVITCPADIVVGNDAGICGAVVTVPDPTVTDNCLGSVIPSTLTHSADQVSIVPLNSVSCNAGSIHLDNSYIRVYDLAAHGITDDLDVTSVDFGIETCSGGGGVQPVVVNLYTWNPLDPFVFASFVPAGTAGASVPDQVGTIFNVPIVATIPAGSTLIVELFTPDGGGVNSFFIGSNPNGQSDLSYLAAPGCGALEPTDIGILGFPGMHIILNVNGDVSSSTDVAITLDSGIPSGGVFPVGTTTNVYIATDSSGNSDTCTVDITVNDTEPPVMVCQDITVQLDASGNASIVAADVDGGTTDNCALDSLSIDISAFDCSDVGANTVTLTAVDSSGNTASCPATVTVEDNVDPVALCQDITVYLDSTGNVTITGADIDNGSNDACGVASLDADPSGFTCDEIGSNSVTLTVTDNNGNTSTCTSTVEVLDTLAPTIICPADIVVSNDPGVCEALVTVPAPMIMDNCGVDTLNLDSVLINGSPGALISNTNPFGIGFDSLVISGLPTGAYVYDLTLDVDITHTWIGDVAVSLLSSESMSFHRMMERPGSPATGSGCSDDDAIVTFDDNGALTPMMLENRCSANPPNSAAMWYNGSAQPIAGMATTFGGDTVNGVWYLIVEDFAGGDDGTLNFWALNIRYVDPNGRVGVLRVEKDLKEEVERANYDLDARASRTLEEKLRVDGANERGIVSLVNDYNGTDDATDIYAVGTTTVTWIATDESGNSDTCTHTITVNDTEPPAMVCDDITVELDAAGSASITVADVDGGTTDNCALDSLSIDISSFDCSDVGGNAVTLTAVDSSGNTASCVAVVTVEDNIPPTITCQDVTIYVDAIGNAGIDPDDVVANSPSSVTIDILTDDFPGETTYELRDGGGALVSSGGPYPDPTTLYTDVISVDCNSDYTFTIFDAFGDGICCGFGAGSYTVTLDGSIVITGGAFGASEATPFTTDPCDGAADNCGIASTTVDQSIFDCSQLGDNTVTVTVTDVNGNTTNCTAQVTVLDTISPMITCPADIVVSNDPGVCEAVVNVPQPTVRDNCTDSDSTEVVLGNPSGAIPDAGAPFCDTVTVGGSGGSAVTGVIVDFNITHTWVGDLSITLESPNGTVVTLMDRPGFPASTFGCNSTLEPAPISLSFEDAASVTAAMLEDTCDDAFWANGLAQPVDPMSDFDGDDVDGTWILCITDNAGGDIGTLDSWVITVQYGSGARIAQGIRDLEVERRAFVDVMAQASRTEADKLTGVNGSNFRGPIMLVNDYNGTDDATDTYPVGTTVVTWTASDSSGNTATCTHTVTVNDTEPPMMVCQDITVYLDATGNVGIVADDVDGGTTDNCAIDSLSIDINSFACPDTGVNVVVLTAVDSSGNTASCPANVTVVDTIPPVAMCQDITVFLDASGNVSILGSDVDNGSSDICGMDTTMVDPSAFDCTNLGPNTVTLTAVDVNGNTSTCEATVEVMDTLAPVITCPADIVQGNDPGVCEATVTVPQPTATDNCDDGNGGVLTYVNDFNGTDDASDVYPAGTTVVEWIVTDEAGNSDTCTMTVRVNDTEPPVAVCQDITVDLDSSGLASIVAADIDGGTTDNCELDSISIDPSESIFDCSDIGGNTVTLTAVDTAGNTSTCDATVTVEDNIAPEVSCQDVTVYLDGAGSASIVAEDVIAVTSSSTIDIDLLTDDFPQETSWEVRDEFGNLVMAVGPYGPGDGNTLFTYSISADCDSDYTFTIFDSFGDGICCGFGAGSYDVSTGGVPVVVGGGAFGASESTTFSLQNCVDSLDVSDNCSVASWSADPTTFGCAELGDNSVTVTVTDASGNTNTCIATVTVMDTIPPVITCPADIVQGNDVGVCEATVAVPQPTATDNCDDANGGVLTFINDFNGTDDASGVYPAGTTVVEWIVTDEAGNSDTCTMTVRVNDTEPPVAVCLNITVELDSMGLASITVADIDGGTTDNCELDSVSIDPSEGMFDCSSVGDNSVTLTAVDTAGNTSTCVAIVTVEDNIAPTVNCQDVTIYLDDDGDASITAEDVIASTGGAAVIDIHILFDDFPTETSFILEDASGNTVLAGGPFAAPDANTLQTFTAAASCDSTYTFTILDAFGDGICCGFGAGAYSVDVNGSEIVAGGAFGGSEATTFDITCLDFADNCSVVSYDVDQTDFTCDETGDNTVTVTVTDPSGNTGSCEATVTVLDTISPTIVCAADTIVGNDPGVCEAFVTVDPPLADDNCGITSVLNDYTGTDDASGVYPVGSTVVTWTATDESGNTSTCQHTVTVEDREAPDPGCPADIEILANVYECSAVVEWELNPTDNCSVDTVFSNFQSGDIFPLGTTTVNVTAIDSSGNVGTCSFDITVTTDLEIIVDSVVDVSCFDGDDGEIYVTIVGGVPPYTVRWSNDLHTEDIEGLVPGGYVLFVEDAIGCTAVTPVILVGEPTPIVELPAVLSDATCFDGGGGSIDVTFSGGTPPYTYEWTNGELTEDVTDLENGVYQVLVTDANGCEFLSSQYVIDEPNRLTVIDFDVTDADCFGAASGGIDITVIGGTPPYSFMWSSGDTTEDILNASAGDYNVTVTDANGCVDITEFVQVEEASEIVISSVTIEDAACNGDASGSINIFVTGGTPPYAYLWSNAAETQDIEDLLAGDYTVDITDANDCTVTSIPFTVGESTALSVDLTTIVDAECNGASTGSISVDISGGTPPYMFQWSDGSTDADLTDVPAGDYSATVTDNNGCMLTTETLTVGEPSEVQIISAIVVDNLCNGGMSGSIDIEVAGGTPPYSYDWSTGDTTEDISGLVTGSYDVTITDENGCTLLSATLVVGETGGIEQDDIVVVDPSCSDTTDASIDITIIGGTPPYLIIWSNGDTTEDLTGIEAGDYSYTVTDVNGCFFESDVVTLVNPSGLDVSIDVKDVACADGSSGIINVEVTGGTPPYDYDWNTGATTEDLTGIPAGIYSVTIMDANGCTFESGDIVVIAPVTVLTGTISATNESFLGAQDGAVDVEVSGGDLPYTYIWNTGDSTEDISNVAQGEFCVRVIDANGCEIRLCADVGIGTGITDLFASDLVLYPNPTMNIANLDVSFTRPVDMLVELVDVLGRVLESRTYRSTVEQQIVFDMNGSASGTYFIRLNVEGEVHSLRLIVQH